MKPLPEAVQRAFPAESPRHPARPWWFVVFIDADNASFFARMEGQSREPVSSEDVAAYDAAHPLPHPGYRAGQVWADDNGSSVVVCAFLYGTVWISRDATGVLRADFARAWPCLMADPSCPHLAPWSPCEVKP